MAAVLGATHHDPLHTYKRLFEAAFTAHGALSGTFTFATPLLFTGLAAAAAFRMNLFNIGAEGQLYMGAIVAAAAAIALGSWPGPLVIAGMCVAGIVGGGLWALIPAVLRARFATNEIITSLMLNYVAALILNYLIFDSLSYWRDTTSATGKVFPQGKSFSDAATWPLWSVSGLGLPLGFLVAILVAVVLWVLYQRTRFGFELQVIGDSPRAAP